MDNSDNSSNSNNKYEQSGSKDFIAGTFGGIAGVIAGHPFDTVKVKIQTMPHIYSSSVVKTFFKIVKREGVTTGLYSGMTSPILGVGLINAIIFGAYGNAMKFVKRWREEHSDEEESDLEHYMDVTLCGSFAGFVNCFVCSPIELVKTRLQVQQEQLRNHILLRGRNTLYKGPLDCLVRIYRKEGFRGVFKGMVPTILRETPSYGAYFACYEYLHEEFGDSSIALFTAGGISGMAAWACSYPFDVVKSRLQALPEPPFPGYNRYTGVMDCVRKCVKEEGYRVFWHGFNACLVRAFPVNAVTFLVYETMMKVL